jgi:Xaa-Pro aminopeptidase
MGKGVSSLLRKERYDTMVLFHSPEHRDSNFVYFTGLKDVTGCFVIGGGRQVLFVSPLEYGLAQQHGKVKNLKVMGRDFYPQLKKVAGKKVGMNFEHLSVNSLKRIRQRLKVKPVDCSSLLTALRSIKREDELASIAKACKITDEIFKDIFVEAKHMKTELELKEFIEEMMRERHVNPSFTTIVASGKHAANPHHLSGSFPLRGMTVIDMGVVVDHYCSDVSRTICFGNPRKKELDMYHMVRSVQEHCLKMVKKGESYFSVHQYAKHHLGKEFIHSIGHGLGLDVHEEPFVRKGDGLLKENMVLTVEPGVYFDGKFGIRLEDDVVVGKTKSKVLSKTSKELFVV